MTSSALNLVRRLAITGGKIGAALQQELWKDPFLLNKLICILDDSQINLEVWEQVIDIIAKLALDEDARQEIGSSQIVIAKLMLVFIGPYDQSLHMAAGEALANLAMDSNANCSAILEETEYDLIKNLKDMLCNDEYRYVAANLLQNLCGHARDELSPPGARGHLRSALPVVIENIKDGQLEALIGLVSQISYVIPEWFVHELESNNNGAGLVTKLVDTLNSNTKPSPEYPRMRRVVIEVVISIVTSCPRYGIIFREQGMVDAPSKVVRYPSEVERYRVFLGNEGVVVERGLPLRDVVNRAKGLIDPATEIPVAQLGDHS